MTEDMKNYYPKHCKTDIEGHRICKGCPKQDVCVSAIIACHICGESASRCHMESHQKSAECKLAAIKIYIEHDFWGFYKAMVDTYIEHEPVKGDTWKTSNWGYLMDRAAVQFEDMENRDDEDFYANIGNYAAMLWVRKNILGVEG